MRLTADLIRSAPAYINPIKERELSLRGFKIPAIENLGVTQDQYETIDLSDNELTRVTNFPVLARLQCLLLNNNRISRVDAGLGSFLPKLSGLILSNNKITSLSDLDGLADLPGLTHVSLLNNPVTQQKDYRAYLISRLPKLKVLDFAKVKPKEREAAVKKFPPVERKKEDSSAPMQLSGGPGGKGAAAAPAKTFIPGEGIPQMMQPKGPTEAQKARLLELIKNATEVSQIDRLEKMLKGQIPVVV